MNYIVFDLEWNQCPAGKNGSDPDLPFEIIEIGGIKLNEKREKISEFHRLVKPQVYNWIHDSIHNVIHVDYKELMNGELFPQAVQEFLDWCGKDFVFCTWGMQDLMELQRNMRYYSLLDLLPGPVIYYDIQKLFSWFHENIKLRRSLEYAIDCLDIEKEKDFHRALEDAEYTARVFAKMDMAEILPYYSIDTYQPPNNRKKEIYISYPTYDKYISRQFHDREKVIKDREVASTRCPVCHLPAKRRLRWFMNNSRIYESISQCQEHGYIKGKVRIRKTDEDTFYAVKTLKPVNEQKAEEIRQKRDSLRRKRNMKYHSDKQIG
ncbi:3'-5' exonuclease [Blautia sp.]|uniref:3'-5' exonuclease n=1 Tax=Blautia sp. TaxID=1955243 RepID=UPI00280A6CDF|nr:3'-5' exonuclease [Blautia sp.]MDY3017791.1 3'-5' exonuclease [Blautia sp.]MED9881363.1 3'-5' exonuclease [Blautia sp.]